jgi:hypothetical protein
MKRSRSLAPLAVIAIMGGLVSAPAAGAANRAVALHGSAKVVMIDDAYLDPQFGSGQKPPSNWLIYHCLSVYALSGNAWRWGIWAYTGGNRRACLPVGSNGIEIMHVDRQGYWVNDLGGDQTAMSPCGSISNWHYRGRPRPSAETVRELLGPFGGCR